MKDHLIPKAVLFVEDGVITGFYMESAYRPSTMLQSKKTQVYISEELAATFQCWEKVGY